MRKKENPPLWPSEGTTVTLIALFTESFQLCLVAFHWFEAALIDPQKSPLNLQLFYFKCSNPTISLVTWLQEQRFVFLFVCFKETKLKPSQITGEQNHQNDLECMLCDFFFFFL